MLLRQNNWNTTLAVALPLFLFACGGGGGTETANTTTRSQVVTETQPQTQPETQPETQNQTQSETAVETVIALAGTPATKVYEATGYTFAPTVSYNGSVDVMFSITNQPAWSTFNALTGELSGTPSNNDIGTTSGIVISASDGTVQATLASFNVTVESTTAQISWNAPTTRDDSSALPLAELAGYRVYSGTAPDALTLLADINNANTTEYTVTGLSPATHYYAVSAYNIYGAESARTAVVSKTIN